MQEEDALIEKKVQQQLGVWVPPILTLKERASLELERSAIIAEIASLEEKVRRKQQAEKDKLER